MSRIYVGNLNPRVTERDLEDEFRVYGVLRSVWVARKPPGYAFVEFDDRRDAMDAIRGLDGRYGWRVELSRSSGGGGGGGSRLRGDDRCYECGEAGHFARECSLRVGPGGLGSGSRRRSPSPRYRHSPSYGRRSMSPHRRSLSPPRRGRYLSPSPIRRDLSPYGRRASPYERRDEYRQPLYYDRRTSPYANGSSFVGRDRRRSLSASL